jgi:uncharacterized protein with PIN domain
MKNIHTLQKNVLNQLGVDHYGKTPTQIKIEEYLINKNIYITNDEEIKRYGEYYLDIDTNEVKTSFENMGKYLSNEKKIILTTDKELIKDGVQAIDDEFLEWFVKNPSCESVEVQDISMQYHEEGYYEYEIIIPKEDWLLNNPQCKQIESCSKSLSKKCICTKEEPTLEEEYLKDELKKYDGIDVVVLNKPEEPKQETLEEVAERILLGEDLDLSDYDKRHILKAMLSIAKWQQEQAERTCKHNYTLTDEQGYRVIKCGKCNDTQPI